MLSIVEDQQEAAPPSGLVFSVIDTERVSKTYGERIISLSIVQVDITGRVLREYSTLLDPGTPVDCYAYHGLRASDLRGQPTFADVAQTVRSILDGTVFVAHNVRSDLTPLRHEFLRCDIPFTAEQRICTEALARNVHPEWSRYSLPACCEHLEVTGLSHHDAISDARATAQVFAHLMSSPRTPTLDALLRPVHAFEGDRSALELIEPIDISEVPAQADNVFAGKRIIFTGAAQAMLDGALLGNAGVDALLREMGMKPAKRIRPQKDSVVVICQSGNRNKIAKARNNDVPVMGEQEFWNQLLAAV